MVQYLRVLVIVTSILSSRETLLFPRAALPWISRNSERRALTRSIHVPVVSYRFYAVHRHWNSRNCRKIYSGYSTASETRIIFSPPPPFTKGQTSFLRPLLSFSLSLSLSLSLQRERYRFENVWKTLVERRFRYFVSRPISLLDAIGKVPSRQICLPHIWNFISRIFRWKIPRRNRGKQS